MAIATRLLRGGAVLGLLLTALIIPFHSARAAWPSGDLPVCTATGSQTHLTIIPDERGGVLIGWEDATYGALYAQRIDAGGNALWTNNGVMLPEGTSSGNPERFLVADGSGGLIFAWEIGGDIYAAHIDSTATADWNVDPVWGFAQRVPVCTASAPQLYVQIATDGAGGIIATWEDHRNSSYPDIYAQRVDASGNPLWTTDGVPVCLDGAGQYEPVIAPDGAGGAYIAWEDHRDSSNSIYLQRIDASGNAQWTVDGIVASDSLSLQNLWPGIVADGTGGAILAWTLRNPDDSTELRRVLGDGSFAWTQTITSGSGVTSGAAEMIPTGDGGVILVSQDDRNWATQGLDVYAFRFDALGNPVWVPGVEVSAEVGGQLRPTGALDAGGVLHLAWIDQRNGSYQIYTQRVDAAGNVLDTVGGVPLSLNPRNALDEPAMTSIAGGAVLAYTDQRNGNDDVFATLFAGVATGVGPVAAPGAVLSANWPNPFRSSTRLFFTLAEERQVELAVYDVAGRRVKTLFLDRSTPGPHFVDWDGTGRGGKPVASGVYFVQLRTEAGVRTRTITLMR